MRRLMHWALVLLWTCSLTIVLDGQRGRPVRPVRPVAPSRPAVEAPETTRSVIDRSLSESGLRSELGRDPTREEVEKEVERLKLLPEAERSEVLKQRLRQLQEEGNLIQRVADSRNVRVVSSSRNSGAFLVLLSQHDGAAPVRYDYLDLLRRMQNPSEVLLKRGWVGRNYTGLPQRAVINLENALVEHRRGHPVQEREVRYANFDVKSGILSIYSENQSRQPEAEIPMPGSTYVEQAELRVLLRASKRLILKNRSVHDDLAKALREVGTEAVRLVDQSPNVTDADLVTAASLGERELSETSTSLLDGLPTLRRGLLGLWDSWRMRLNYSDRHAWRRLRRGLMPPEGVTASRAAIPNSHAKLAVLLMAATENISALNKIRQRFQ